MKNYRLVCLVLLVCLISALGTRILAQDHLRLIAEGERDFEKITEAFYTYWDRTGNKDSDLKKFKRWEHFILPRLENGNLPGSGSFSKRVTEFSDVRARQSLRTENLNAWEPLGPYQWDVAQNGYSPGNGRVNCITVDPSDPDKIFVGAAAGGVWISEDGGQSWATTTDHFAVLGVTDIHVNEANPQIVTVLTGDAYGSDTPSIGVLRSVDGGLTWNQTGLQFDPDDFNTFYKYDEDPTNSDMQLVAGKGIYLSDDGGLDWNEVLPNWVSDLMRHPLEPNILYAVSRHEEDVNDITTFKSIDGGYTWTKTVFNISRLSKTLGRKALGVSPDNPDAVYILATESNSEFGGVFKSVDKLETLDLQSSTPNIFGYSRSGSGSGGQGWYDLAIAVDPDDENILYASGVHIWKSIDSGVTWDLQNYWVWNDPDYPYVHADNHTLDIYNGKLYAGGDGGIFMSPNGGEDFVNLSFGLNIGQFYRLSTHPTDENRVAGGLQDNGSYLRYNNTWSQVYGADGMEAIIDHTDPSISYSSLQFGSIIRYSDNGQQIDLFLGKPSGESGGWVTPFIMHPTDHNTIYVGFTDVYKSTQQGSNLKQISTFQSPVPIRILKQSPKNPDYLIAFVESKIMLTDNGGSTWKWIQGPPSNSYITDVSFSYADPELIYVTLSNWASSEKVYRTHNRGDSWVNISEGLPSVPMNCIISKNDCSGTLFTGTDIGVYYTNDFMTGWELLGKELPNVIVSELEIQEATNKLHAATYGRGIWKLEMEASSEGELLVDEISPKAFGDPDFEIFFTASEPEDVTIMSSDPDVLSINNTIASIGKAGEVVIILQMDDCIKEVPLIIDRSEQQVTFDPLGSHKDSEWDFLLTASSTSGLPVSFNSQNQSVIKIEDNLASILKSGSSFITAIQTGNDNYKPSIAIRQLALILEDLEAMITIYPNPVTTELLKIAIPKNIGEQHVSIFDINGRKIMERDIPASREAFELNVSELEQGMYFIKFDRAVRHFFKR